MADGGGGKHMAAWNRGLAMESARAGARARARAHAHARTRARVRASAACLNPVRQVATRLSRRARLLVKHAACFVLSRCPHFYPQQLFHLPDRLLHFSQLSAICSELTLRPCHSPLP
eukprot:4747997-Pleurochrysis_carterae.AAC.2